MLRARLWPHKEELVNEDAIKWVEMADNLARYGDGFTICAKSVRGALRRCHDRSLVHWSAVHLGHCVCAHVA